MIGHPERIDVFFTSGNATEPALEAMTSLLSDMKNLAAARETGKQLQQQPPVPGLRLSGNVASVEVGVRTVNAEETEEEEGSTLENENEGGGSAAEQERTAIHGPASAARRSQRCAWVLT